MAMARKKKRLRELTDADIAACEPESIWLETRKCPLPAHCVLWVVVLLLISAVVWACLAKVDVVVVAEGKLVTSRPNITMKPLERTVVKSVPVRVGQVVEKGDVLVEFDPTVNAAELKSLTAQREHHLCRKHRLLAEKAGAAELVFPDVLAGTPAAQQQLSLFLTRKDYYTKRCDYLNGNINRYKGTVASLEKALRKYTELMEPILDIENRYVKMADEGTASKVEMMRVRMQRMGNEIEMENQCTRLVEDTEMMQSAFAELETFRAEWLSQIDEQLAETELQLVALEEKIRQSSYLASIEYMRAPCRAVVHEIAPYQEGSAVREAESLISLIPLDVPLEAEIDILPKDVGLLRRGDTARLKMEAFPFQKHGMLEGSINFISADTYESASNLDAEGAPAATGGKRPQYRARLQLAGELAGVPQQSWQSAGMKLRAEIKVGERTVISYLLHPFLKAMDESIREP